MMTSRRHLLVLLSILQCISVSRALYFHIDETERKCFIEEIPDDTMVIGKYKVEAFDERTNSYMPSAPGIGMHVEVKDPDEKIVLSKLYTSEGRFTFTSHTPGEHVICLFSNSSAWFGGQKLVGRSPSNRRRALSLPSSACISTSTLANTPWTTKASALTRSSPSCNCASDSC